MVACSERHLALAYHTSRHFAVTITRIVVGNKTNLESKRQFKAIKSSVVLTLIGGAPCSQSHDPVTAQQNILARKPLAFIWSRSTILLK
jgi:hypothetical protein